MLNQNNKGQVLVLVALGLFVLVGAVMLAVDVGSLYAERRHMQNAADAGALAGARELCFESGNEGTAEGVAIDYATVKNQAQFADVTIWPSGSFPITVTVVASETKETFFGGLVGIATADVNASASATCGPAAAASGLFPIALKDTLFDYFYGESCAGKDEEDGAEFYVVLDRKGGGGGKGGGQDNIPCAFPDDGIPDEQQFNCDLLPKDEPDGIVDVFAWRTYYEGDFTSGGDRGWIDFSAVIDESGPFEDVCNGSGCGTKEIMCRMREGSGALLEPPFCVPGVSGMKLGSLQSSHFDDVIGTYASLPIFQNVGCGGACADLAKPGKNNCGGGGRVPVNFCVTDFACAKVVGFENKWISICGMADPDNCVTRKAIKFQIYCGNQQCQTNVGYTDPGQTGNPYSLRAVNLTN